MHYCSRCSSISICTQDLKCLSSQIPNTQLRDQNLKKTSHMILISFLVPNISNGVMATGPPKKMCGRSKAVKRFSTTISLYLRKGAREVHSYYETLIVSHMHSNDSMYSDPESGTAEAFKIWGGKLRPEGPNFEARRTEY